MAKPSTFTTVQTLTLPLLLSTRPTCSLKFCRPNLTRSQRQAASTSQKHSTACQQKTSSKTYSSKVRMEELQLRSSLLVTTRKRKASTRTTARPWGQKVLRSVLAKTRRTNCRKRLNKQWQLRCERVNLDDLDKSRDRRYCWYLCRSIEPSLLIWP